MYARDSLGRRTNTTEWKAHNRLLRLDNTSWSTGFNYTCRQKRLKKRKPPPRDTQERKDIVDYYDYYVDFDIPWSFSVSYTFSYNKTWNSPPTKRIAAINPDHEL